MIRLFTMSAVALFLITPAHAEDSGVSAQGEVRQHNREMHMKMKEEMEEHHDDMKGHVEGSAGADVHVDTHDHDYDEYDHEGSADVEMHMDGGAEHDHEHDHEH